MLTKMSEILDSHVVRSGSRLDPIGPRFDRVDVRETKHSHDEAFVSHWKPWAHTFYGTLSIIMVALYINVLF